MTFKDRTSEFNHLIQASPNERHKPKIQNNKKSEFSQSSIKIEKTVTETFQKIKTFSKCE
jgi:hypothetical protein